MIGFLLSIGISLAVSILLIRAISSALNQVLTEACDTEKRSQFWLIFTKVMVVFTPLLFVMIFVPVSEEAPFVFDVVFLRQTLGSIISGLFFAMLGIGFQISRLSPQNPFPKPKASKSENEFWGDKDAGT